MIQKIKPVRIAITLLALTCLAGIGWQKTPAIQHKNFVQDTIPKKEKTTDKTVINGDLEKAMQDVKKAQENLDRQFQNTDWQQTQKELKKAQEAMNAENVQEQIAKTLKEIDFQKIQLQTQEAMQKFDWEKMQKELQRVHAELKNTIDSKKINAEISQSMEETKKAMAELKAVDMAKIREEMERETKELNLNEGAIREEMERAKKEINETLHKDLKKELEKAKEEIKHAAAELQQYKDMVNEMYKDGLIKSKEQYDIHYKNGDLFINGAKQSADVTGKYKHYFKKENVRISRGKDDDDKIIDL